MEVAEPRVEVIEGRRTLVVERRPPLQPKLDGLLAALTLTYRDDIRPTGYSVACELRNHHFRRFREGRHIGTDGIVRDLALRMCSDCAAVEVRDVSYHVMGDVKPGRGGPRRKSDLIGWYSGARKNNREYR